MADTLGKVGQCSAEYAQEIAGLEGILGVDLPDCAKLELSVGTSSVGPFEGINATSESEDGKKVMLSFDSYGACFENGYSSTSFFASSTKNCSGAKSIYSLSLTTAAAAILRAKEIWAKF